MSTILLTYSTTDGHTLKISQKMQHIIEQQGHLVTLLPIEKVSTDTLAKHDKTVIGASIRYGKHQRQVVSFIQQHKAQLDGKPSAFYTVNLVARKPEKCQPDTNPYIVKLMAQLAWQPSLQGVFAGRLNYKKYGFLDRNMIRFIMWMTKGPTDPATDQEFTDWDSVERFAQAVSDMT
ncbi:menaquinone-dependent protoporphyrinogen IX dehydrogenase [Marinomonas sp. IMCC 4694]|uniref:menaquinone-dependent protoporphyrinogen IX dehydrogenase n=1 Tax=Marinomonas sp. IMCC 4694 TaxID=2605432 RepID=UPI0011E7CC1C|nr:menaquinone-dependent protoporphyrinogen IX dehydrogenase [Marinomonas sp. IMCC 4694]TYL48370.1 menaquinone-dependent protoporphyrinogen IX dehydrogenase [Marinomonas sp. IMCC 4694]